MTTKIEMLRICASCIAQSDKEAPEINNTIPEVRINNAVHCYQCGALNNFGDVNDNTPKVEGTFYTIQDPDKTCAAIHYSYALADTPVVKCDKCGCTYPKGIEVFEHGTFVGDEFDMNEDVEFTYCEG